MSETSSPDASRDDRHRGRRSWLLGAAALLVPALVLLLAATDAAVMPAAGVDGYWVAAVGRSLPSPLSAPRHNGLSYTSPEHPWVMHEWLWAWPFSRGLAAQGPPFFALVATLLVLAVGGTLLLTAIGRSRHLATAAIITAMGLIALPTIARPTYLALPWALLLVVIGYAPRFGIRHVVAAALVELLWANSHGTFPLGILLLAAGAFDHRHDGQTRSRRVAAVGLAALATLLNPYGPALHRLVLDYALGASPSLQLVHAHIYEFFPAWQDGRVLTPTRWMLLACCGLLAVRPLLFRAVAIAGSAQPDAGLTATGNRYAGRMTVSLFIIGSVLWQVRHVHFAVVVLPLLLLPELDAIFDFLVSQGYVTAGASISRRRRMTVAIVALSLTATVALGTHAWARTQPERVWVSRRLGGGALPGLVGRLPNGARVFATFDVASRVLWLGAQRGIRVYYDSRNDCYPAEILASGYGLDLGGPNAEDAAGRLRAADTTHVLVRRRSPLARQLRHDPNCQTLAEGGDLLLLQLTAPRPVTSIVDDRAGQTLCCRGARGKGRSPFEEHDVSTNVGRARAASDGITGTRPPSI